MWSALPRVRKVCKKCSPVLWWLQWDSAHALDLVLSCSASCVARRGCELSVRVLCLILVCSYKGKEWWEVSVASSILWRVTAGQSVRFSISLYWEWWEVSVTSSRWWRVTAGLSVSVAYLTLYHSWFCIHLKGEEWWGVSAGLSVGFLYLTLLLL